MAIMTIEQALASTATGITIVDTATNIARAAGNTGLGARVIAFNMSGSGAVSPIDAGSLATLGSKFSRNGFTLTVRGTVADLTNSLFAAGVALASVTAVLDTAANILAAAGQPVITGAGSVVMSSSADVTMAGMIAFTTMPGFSVFPGSIITLADTAANLLAIPNYAKRGALQAYKVSVTSTVDAATAVNLTALQNFSVATGVTLTIADSVSALLDSGMVTRLPGFAAIPRVVVQAADTIANLLAAASSLTTLATSVSGLRTRATDNPEINADQATALAALPQFSASSGAGLTVLDTAVNLLALANNVASLIGQATISAAATVDASQAASLVARFASLDTGGGLTIADTLAAIAGLSTEALNAGDSVVIDDSATNLIGAGSLPSGIDAIIVRIDGATYTIAQIEAFLDNVPTGVTVTLEPANGNAALRVADTLVHLASAGAIVNALAELGPVVVAPTDNGGVISAADAATLAGTVDFDPRLYALSVVDTGANLSSVAADIFGQGFLSITVSSGVLVGTAAQLLDANLTFGTGATAQLGVDSTISAVQAQALSALPGFSLAVNVDITVSDRASALADSANAAGLALASVIVLAEDALIDAQQAATLAAFGGRFSDGGHAIAISDTLADLVALAGSPSLSIVNGWDGPVILSAAATASVADAVTLSDLTHFASGPAPLTVAGTVADLLHVSTGNTLPDAWTVLLEAGVVTLTEDSVVSSAEALLLLGLGSRFDRGSFDLVMEGTPLQLAQAASAPGLADMLSGFALVDLGSPWVITAARAATLADITSLDTGPGLIVSDTVTALLGAGSTDGFALADSVTISQNSTVTAALANALFAIPNFTVSTHTLTVSDSGARLAALDPTAAALATEVLLSGNSLLTAAQFSAVRALPNLDLDGHILIVSDTATNLLALGGSDLSLMGMALMTGTATLDAGQAADLAGLPGFSGRADRISVSDSAANMLHDGDGLNGPDDWAGLLLAGTVTLSGDATVTAAEATQLSLLGTRFSLGGHELIISDTAAALLNPANAAGLRLATEVTMPSGAATITAAQALRLSLMSDFDPGTSIITISDTAEALSFSGHDSGLAIADHIQLSVATTLTVAQARALIGEATFQENGAAPITISDTLANLLAINDSALTHNDAILDATRIALSADATGTAAELVALRALPQYNLSGTPFDLNGHQLVLRDSGRAIATFTTDLIAPPTSYVLAGDAILTAAQATVLAARSVNVNGNTITVSDTPAQILSSLNADGVALADDLILSANATVAAGDAVSLFADVRFTTGGRSLTVIDTADALIALSDDIKLAVTRLKLAADDTVTATELRDLAEFGIKFSTDGHAVTVVDTATALADLGTIELNLTDEQRLGTSAVVSARTAEDLASLPNFVLAGGVTLTIEDTVTHLGELSSGAAGIASAVRLPSGTTVTVTAAEAAALADLPNFTNTGATIIVRDTIANLNASLTSAWQSVATSYEVEDSIGSIAANASTPLLVNADEVNPTGDSTIDAATAAILASIAAFDAGSRLLIVVDDPAEIAANATAILSVATIARINQSTAITVAEADAIAAIDAAGKLSFTAGHQLNVDDNYANLSNSANADGLALADGITVRDTAAQLALAAVFDWDGRSPDYVMTGNATVDAATAVVLSTLGADLSPDGHTLTVADGPDAVGDARVALNTLGAPVEVTGSAAAIGARVAHLLLVDDLTEVTLTDVGPLSAADAAGLHEIASLLTGGAVAVADDATDVAANVADLLTMASDLGTVQVTDTASAVAAVASTLAGLTTHLAVTLTDTTPISAAIASGLLPVLARLDSGTIVDVTDTAVNLAADATDLASLGAVLGEVTISGSTPQTAAVAVGLLPIEANLASGASVAVADTVANVVTHASDLATLIGEGRISAIDIAGATASAIVTNGSVLDGLSANVTISDTAANLNSQLDGLAAFATAGLITGITLTDGSPPVITVSIAQLVDDADVLDLIGSLFTLRVSDTAAHIQTDLAGGSPALVAALADVDEIVISDAGTVSLTVAQIGAAGVNDGSGSVLDKLSGGAVAVVGATVAEVAGLAAMDVVPDSIAVSDTASAIATDLNMGGSVLVTHRALISGIAVSDSGAVSLTATRAVAGGVNDGSGSVMSKVSGGTFVVTDVAAADVTTVLGLSVTPDSISITDSAANLEANLVAGGSTIRANLADISAITVSPAGTITLTAAQALAPTFNDGAGSALGKMTGVSLAVTQAEVAQIDDLMALGVVPASIAVQDTVAHIESDLALGGSSLIVGNLAAISAVVASPSGTLTLTASQALATDVDDALALVSGVTLHITDTTVSQLDGLLALTPTPSEVTVSDTAANIAADIAAGGLSDLVAHRATLATITVSDSGAVTLTQSQALAANVADGAGSVATLLSGGTFVVTGVDVAHIDAVLGLHEQPDSIDIVDTAANLSADLAAGGSSDILANLSDITAITNSDAGAITLTAAQALVAGVNDGPSSAMAKVVGGSLVLTAAAIADIDAIMAMHIAPASFGVSATAAQIQADLAAGGSSDIVANRALISSIVNSDTGVISLTQAQVLATGVNDGAGSAMAKVSGGSLVVTGVSIANVATILALGVPPASITVSDTAANIAADLALGAGSVLLANVADITSVAVSDSGVVALTLAQWQFAGVNDGAGSIATLLSGGTTEVVDLAVADIDAAVALPEAPDSLAISDTAANIQTDLTAGGSSDILANIGDVSVINVSDAGMITLSLVQMQAAGVNDGPGSAMARLSGGTVQITGLSVADMDGVLALPNAPDIVAISDTAANIAADLALGGASDLVAGRALISAVSNSNAGAITLTSAQVQATGVNDGVGSVMSKVTGGTLVVTGVATADVATILGLPVVPASITVSDTAANIAADLALGAGSALVANIGDITAITNSNAGVITLTSAQVQATGVNDGAGSVMAKVSGGSLVVTGVAVADIDTILALDVSPSTITISDTAAAIQADLVLGGSSEILAALGNITSIGIGDGGTVSLTLAQMQVAGVNDGVGSAAALMTGGTLRVTGVTVAQLDTVAALPDVPDAITVSDTAANIASDIASGGASDLLASNALITTITNSNAGAITLTAAQVLATGVNDGVGSVLSKVSGGSLVVTGATVAQVDTILGLPVAPASITVSDTAANLGTDLALGASSDLVGNRADITSITNSNAGVITLTSAQVQVAGVNDGVGSVMSKVSGGSLVVTGVSVADIDTILALDVPPATITLSDTAANIQADLALGASSEILAALGTVNGITISDGGVVSLSLAQLQFAGVNDGAGSAAALMTGGTLRASGLSVAQIDTALALPEVPDSLSVSDTAANIAADIVSGGSSDLLANRTMIASITNSNAGAITLTAAQVQVADVNDGPDSILAKVTGGSLTVTGVAVPDIDTITGLTVPPTAMTVTGTAAQIAADLAAGGSSDILAHLAAITAITNSDVGVITLTGAQALMTGVNDGVGSAMSKVSGGSLVVTGVAVADIDAVMDDGVTPASITVTDTAANIQSDLALGAPSSDLTGRLASITAITVSPAGTVTLTAARVLASDVNDGAGSVFGKMSGVTLAVTEAAIADLSSLYAMQVTPTTIVIGDSATNILSDLSGAAEMAAHAAEITSVKPTDATMTVTDASTILSGLSGIGTFDVSDLTITGTAAQLLSAHGSTPTLLSGADAVTMSNNPTGLTAGQATTLSGILGGVLGGGQTMEIADTLANLLNGANSAGVSLATTVALSGPTTTTAALATQVVGIADFNVAAQPITVNDTLANILDPANAAGVAAATTVTPNADITVTAAQLAALDAIAGFGDGGHDITVEDTVANILGLTNGNLSLATTVQVTDSIANAEAAFTGLKTTVTDNGHTLSLTLSDAVTNTIAVTVTAATYSSLSAVMGAITNDGVVRVIGTASQLAALAATLSANDAVKEVWVSDTAANILSNLTTLNSMGSKFTQATLTDTTISATEVGGLIDIPNLAATNLTVSDTGAQIAAAVAAADSDGLAFINSLTVELSEDSVITALDAVALQGLTNLDKNGHTLKVWDSASNLTNSADGYLAAVNDASIDAVHLKTVAGSVTISPATAAVLLTITNFSKDNPNSTTNTLTVSGTAATIEANYATLDAHLGLISGVTVSNSATVTDAVYAHLLDLGAVAGGGVNLTVRDTASKIATNAPVYLASSPSITPTTWTLSGSASVTAANAAILGGLSGFSAGAYTLTLSADASGLSVADANKIGTLASSFSLGGKTLELTGDVSALMGLSSNAKTIVTPHITDTFANIATMTKADNLLGGTITISDSATVTVTQASNFLGLLQVGGVGAGIAAAKVDFDGNVESVTDTFSNITTLTGSAGWTSNSTVHDDFNLVVADSVSTLVNGSNTASLSSMNATTFSSNQTTTAVNAQSLFGLKDTIHFNRGSYTLTISDTTTNLLNATYDDGKAFADAWQLNGNATVTAADAEALLAESKFQLNHTLTISDTSDNLLDGVLSPLVNASPYKASIEIELSGPETLNARTAAKIVALPGFSNTGDLSIQDGASYLLNPANLTAETMATSVTLAGDETVSALTAYRLSVIPNFTLGSNTLYLASHDYANLSTLTAIANYADGFDVNGKSIKLTQSALALTPTQYTELQDDNIVLNGHAMSALATGVSFSSGGGTIHVTGSGVDGATLKVYASDTTVLNTVNNADENFDVTASTGSIVNGIVVTSILGGSAATGESAPIIALQRGVITTEASSAGATFATSGEVQVDTNQYMDLYTSATAPGSHANPILVYDPTAHTLAMRIDGHGSLTLVTLGTATFQTEIDDDQIYIRHFT